MFVVKKQIGQTENWEYSLCVVKETSFTLRFYNLVYPKKETALETLPTSEKEWKVMKNTIVENMSFDIGSRVLYSGTGTILIFMKNSLHRTKLTFKDEESAIEFTKTVTYLIQKSAEQAKLSKFTKRAKPQGTQRLLGSGITAPQSGKGALRNTFQKVDIEASKSTVVPQRFPKVQRGKSIEKMNISIKAFMLETDSIAEDRSEATGQFYLSSLFNTSRKKDVMSSLVTSSFRNNNEYKTYKKEGDKKFLRKCLLDFNTFHGVLVRDFNENTIEHLINAMYKVKFTPNEEIVSIGEVWDQFFIVDRGSVIVKERKESNGTDGDEVFSVAHLDLEEKRLVHGASVGVMCLLTAELSRLCVFGETAGHLWAIRKNSFEAIRTENNLRIEEVKELLLRKIIKQSDLEYNAKQMAHFKNGMDIRVMLEGDSWIPDESEEPILLCYGGLLDILLEEEVSHSIQENEIHGLKSLHPLRLKAGLLEISFKAKRKTILIEVNAREIRKLLSSLKVKLDRQTSNSKLLKTPHDSSMGLKSKAHLRRIFGNITFRTVSKASKLVTMSNFALTTSALSISTRPQCIDVPIPYYDPLIDDLNFYDLDFVRKLGSGQYGSVYLVKCEYDNESYLYALKSVARDNSFKSFDAFVKLDYEKQIMTELSACPKNDFIVKLYHSFADLSYIYYVMEYCWGSDLGNHLISQPNERLPESDVKFYIACTILGLELVHSMKIVYRDLKPENMFLDNEGYSKLGDFGISKKSMRTFTVWGTLEYQAPEMILHWGYDGSVDIWALGIVTFELLFGFTPFYTRNKNRAEVIRKTLEHRRNELRQAKILDLYEKTECKIDPPEFSPEFVDFINAILDPNPRRRIGCSSSQDISRLKTHPFFEGFDWVALEKRELESPYVPDLVDYTARIEPPKLVPYHETSTRRKPDVNRVLYVDE